MPQWHYRLCLGVSLLFAATACVQPSGQSRISSLRQSPSSYSAKSIEHDLTRSNHIIFKVTVKAYPLTIALMSKIAEEESKKRGYSAEETQKKHEQVANAYQDQSCFRVTLISADIDATNFAYWGVQIVQDNTRLKGHFLDENSAGYAVKRSHYYTSTYANFTAIDRSESVTYYNDATLCTEKNQGIDFTKAFKLKFTARYLKKPKDISLRWDPPK